MSLTSSVFRGLKNQSDINVLVCDTDDGNEGRTHLRVEVADKQDADTSGERRESNSGSPGEGQGGQGSRQSGDCQTCRGEDH